MDTDRGRRAVGGKIEVRVRIRDPLSEKDVHIDKWKWLVIDLHLSSKKVRRSCDNRIVVTHSLPHALRLASQQRAGGTGASQKETRPLINSPQFFMPLPQVDWKSTLGNAYQRKEIQTRMAHFNSTFTTDFIKWFSEIHCCAQTGAGWVDSGGLAKVTTASR